MDLDGAPWRALPSATRPATGERLRVLATVVLFGYVAALLLGPHHFTFWRDWGLQCLALALQAGYVWYRLIRERAHRRWRLPIAGVPSFLLIGNLLYNAHLDAGETGPWPVVTMAVTVLAYPCGLVLAVMILRGRRSMITRGAVLDMVVAALTIWAYFLAILVPAALRVSRDTGQPTAQILLLPIGDLAALTIAVAAMTLTMTRPEPMAAWSLAAFCLFPLADSLFALGTATGTWAGGTPLDAIWVVGSALVSLGAFAAPVEQGQAGDANTWTIALPLLAALAAVTLVGIATRIPLPPEAVALALAGVLMSLIRLADSYRALTRLAETHRLAYTDDLTGLANRRGFGSRLDALLGDSGTGSGLGSGPVSGFSSGFSSGSGTGKGNVALALVDLDHFKEVNDTLGHAVGDQLLAAVADRLAEAAAPTINAAGPGPGVVARLGGDEFAVIAPGAGPAESMALARRLLAALEEPVLVAGGRLLRAQASVGVAVAVQGELPAGELLRRADIAMYRAKRTGHGAHLFDPDGDLPVPAPATTGPGERPGPTERRRTRSTG